MPERSCIGCGAKREKAAMVRLVAPQGRAELDRKALRPGRGAYVCNEQCLRTAVSKRSFSRAFRRQVTAGAEIEESMNRGREDSRRAGPTPVDRQS